MTPWPYCKAEAHLEQGSSGRHSTPEMPSGTTGLPIAAAEGSYHNAGGPPSHGATERCAGGRQEGNEAVGSAPRLPPNPDGPVE